METQGQVIIGDRARSYDLRMIVNGLYFVHRKVLSVAKVAPGEKVLDIGCGTGALLSMLSQKVPLAELYGVEPSRDMLHEALKRRNARGLRIQFIEGFAEDLPFGDDSFDVAISSLTFHHLPRDAKKEAINEVWRVLKPGGRFILSDYGSVQNMFLRRMADFIWRRHAFASENLNGVVRELLDASRFSSITTVAKQGGVMHHIVAIK